MKKKITSYLSQLVKELLDIEAGCNNVMVNSSASI